jgi:hypothetical protein
VPNGRNDRAQVFPISILFLFLCFFFLPNKESVIMLHRGPRLPGHVRLRIDVS